MDDSQDPQDDSTEQPSNWDSGEADPSGSAPEDIQDVDQEEKSVGLPTDTENGPRELGVGEDVNTAEEDHIKN